MEQDYIAEGEVGMCIKIKALRSILLITKSNPCPPSTRVRLLQLHLPDQANIVRAERRYYCRQGAGLHGPRDRRFDQWYCCKYFKVDAYTNFPLTVSSYSTSVVTPSSCPQMILA